MKPPEHVIAVDPITLEVLQESLISVVQEMRANMIRTAYSSVLYEGEDLSCALLTTGAELVGMSKGRDHPAHIFPLSFSLKVIKERFGGDIGPGDVFLHNDPYTGGTHLNDIAMVYPVFLDNEPFLFAVVRAHWADVGGMTYGSISGQTTEIYQEGIRIPPIRVYTRGVPNEAVLEIIFSNMRVRKEREGDFRAMLGICHMAEARLLEVAQRFGEEILHAGIRELLDRAERRMRHAISQLPAGEYAHEVFLESGKTTLEPLRIYLKLTVKEDEISADFTGTAPQASSPNNVGPGLLPTGVFVVLKSFLDPDAEINHGSFRPIDVVAPVGTLVNCRHPAPAGGSTEVTLSVEAAAMGAMAPAFHGRITGDVKGGANHVYIGGVDPETKVEFVWYEYPAAGVGAFHGHDGNNVTRSFLESDITSMQPIEAVENRYPLRVEYFGLREDSGGDGEWRGGLGCRRAIRILTGEAQLSIQSGHNIIPPFGVCRGYSGAPNRFSVIRNGEEIFPPSLPGKVSGFSLEENDVVLIQTSGGGGFGDPLDRDARAVLRDVLEGYVTRDKATEIYGVAIAEDIVDFVATKQVRQRLKHERATAVIQPWTGDEYLNGFRLCILTASVARDLNVGDGDLVEIVNPNGAPLRGFVRVLEGNPDADMACYLGPVGKKILGIGDGLKVELRRLSLPGKVRAASRSIVIDK